MQRVDKCHLGLSEKGIALEPLALHYTWPDEPDLMARRAGLGRRDSWGSWSGEPFDARSIRHVTVYGR